MRKFFISLLMLGLMISTHTLSATTTMAKHQTEVVKNPLKIESMTNQDIVFASLMGIDAVQSIERFRVVDNWLDKHVLPPVPFLPWTNKINTPNNQSAFLDDTAKIWEQKESIPEGQQFFPLSFSFTEDGTKWTFPYEPMLTISSGNNIIERNVAKHRPQNENDYTKREVSFGTIKERWSRKDFDITITGALFGSLLRGTPEQAYPTKKMQELFNYLTYAKELYVYSEALQVFGVNKVVVYDYSFPFTKGENVQAYEIKCKSDTAHKLFIEI